MAKDKDEVKSKDWGPRIQDMPTIGPVPHVDPEESLTDRAKGSRYWLKAHGDAWIETAMMGDIMDHRARLIYEYGAHVKTNPFRTVNLARRLKIHNSGLCAWQQCRQFPKSFAAWRRLCRALGLSFEIIVRDKQTGKVIFQGTK